MKAESHHRDEQGPADHEDERRRVDERPYGAAEHDGCPQHDAGADEAD